MGSYAPKFHSKLLPQLIAFTVHFEFIMSEYGETTIGLRPRIENLAMNIFILKCLRTFLFCS